MKYLIKKSSKDRTATAVLVSASVITTAAACAVLFSCDNEEEYYENGNYTLAKKRVTRSYSDGPGGDIPQKPTDDPSMYYNGGSKDVEISLDGLRLKYNFSWGEGRWNWIRPHFRFVSCDNQGGYQEYTDQYGIKRKVNNIEYVSSETSAGPQVHETSIEVIDLIISYRRCVSKIENGKTIYVLGPIEEKISSVSVSLEEYRKHN